MLNEGMESREGVKGIEENEYRTESVDFSSLCYTTPRLTAFPQLLTLRQS